MAVPVIITNVSAEGTLSDQVRRQVATLLRGMAGRTVQIRVGLHKSRRQRTPKMNTTEFVDFANAAEQLLLEYGADLSAWAERDVL